MLAGEVMNGPLKILLLQDSRASIGILLPLPVLWNAPFHHCTAAKNSQKICTITINVPVVMLMQHEHE